MILRTKSDKKKTFLSERMIFTQYCRLITVKKEKNTKLFLHLKKWLEKAVLDFKMIEEGDRLLIGVSGGADSFALLDLLDSPMIFVPGFSFIAVNIDMGFDPDYIAYNQLEKYLQENNYPYVLEKTDIGLLAHSDYNKKNPCFLCSRLRRKRIFEIAEEKGCNKIAFAHHKDDIIETLLHQYVLWTGNQHDDAQSKDIRREAAYHPAVGLFAGGIGQKIQPGAAISGGEK